MASIYSSSKVQTSGQYTPYSKFIEVYGLKILGLGKIGGQPAVQDEFLEKTAQTFKLLLNPNARGINKKHQTKALKALANENVIQRVGVEAYDAYVPRLNMTITRAGTKSTTAQMQPTSFGICGMTREPIAPLDMHKSPKLLSMLSTPLRNSPFPKPFQTNSTSHRRTEKIPASAEICMQPFRRPLITGSTTSTTTNGPMTAVKSMANCFSGNTCIA